MELPERPDERAAWVEGVLRACCHTPANSLQDEAGERAWDDPIVGYSRGDDPLYRQYKEHVGPFHWTPAEAFALAYPGLEVDAAELTVICWVLPHTQATLQANRRETFYPAERWARSRIFGEQFNDQLRAHLVQALQAAGYRALAPVLLPQWESVPSERFVYASNWSERHAAYASGLGTFGLCDGLITPVGKAVRIGSVIARLAIPPMPRPYADHHAYCLYYSRGTCRRCIERCPVGAISEKGHDKRRCREHVAKVTSPYVKAHYGFDGYGCGLCQTGVPCEHGIPEGE